MAELKGDKEFISDMLSAELPVDVQKGPAEPVEPAAPAEPTEPVEPAEPVEPVEPIEPVEPVAPVEPTEPTVTEPEVDIEEMDLTTVGTDPKALAELLQKAVARISEVRSTINEVVKGAPAPQPAAQPKPEPKPVISAQEAVNKLTEALKGKKDFLTQEELDKVIDNPALINDAISRAQTGTATAMMEAMPTIVGELMKQQLAAQRLIDDFYTKNGDLADKRDYVRSVSMEIAQDQNLSVEQMLDKTAKEVRKRLRMPEPKAVGKPLPKPAAPVQRGAKPAFAQQRKVAATPKPAPAKPGDDQKAMMMELIS